MTTQLWIGFGFLGILVIFQMITILIPALKHPTPPMYNTYRFLTALCGAFAGGFITGHALIEIEQISVGGGKLAITGAAGFAIFILIWFTYDKWHDEPKLRYYLSIPDGWTFGQGIVAVEVLIGKPVSYHNIAKNILQEKMRALNVNAESHRDALMQLRFGSPKIPAYKIDEKDGGYYLYV